MSKKFRCHYETMTLGKYKQNTGKNKTTHDNKFNELKA